MFYLRYSLQTADDVILTSFQSIVSHTGDLRYILSKKLPICSSNEWNELCTSILKVRIEEVTVPELLGKEGDTLSEKARALINKLSDINQTILSQYESHIRKEESQYLVEPVRKCLYRIKKCRFNDALVDSLISLLFHELGFYSGMLYPVPQHSLPLQYGGNENFTAKADFKIIDILNYCRMVVTKDTFQCGDIVNSFPQLMAESISAFQVNLDISDPYKRKWEELEESVTDSVILGLRVNSITDEILFYFYNINVSRPILSAMKLKGPASEYTLINSVGDHYGLHFLIPEQRKIIITILDTLAC
mmetsp:Transcript_23506/g.32184  ORF Transcript_23506/g.32184 Transcript_23506/m.32184 type:complete len:305 (+) Transcript_23506:146-1060(+)